MCVRACSDAETSDHGPFNSWDRQPFLTDVADPSKPPSLIPAYNTIEHNFMVANYGANGGCVDNDDGSSYYMCVRTPRVQAHVLTDAEL